MGLKGKSSFFVTILVHETTAQPALRRNCAIKCMQSYKIHVYRTMLHLLQVHILRVYTITTSVVMTILSHSFRNIRGLMRGIRFSIYRMYTFIVYRKKCTTAFARRSRRGYSMRVQSVEFFITPGALQFGVFTPYTWNIRQYTTSEGIHTGTWIFV